MIRGHKRVIFISNYFNAIYKGQMGRRVLIYPRVISGTQHLYL